MIITADITDINGQPIWIGDRVLAYQQDYEEISCDIGDGCKVVEIDISRPKPMKDVPLFTGRVFWSNQDLALQVQIEEMHVEWSTKPASLWMGGGSYLYEKLNDQPAPIEAQ